MGAIKNIKALHGLISMADLEKLERGALLHFRYSNITFKIIDVAGTNITIRTEQGKSSSGNYATTQVLIERTKELFSNVIKLPIIVHPVVYSYPASDIVDSKWLNEHMLRYGIKVNTIAKDTGIEKSNISAWVNGLRPMSKTVKEMLYMRMATYGLNHFAKSIKNAQFTGTIMQIKKVFNISIIESMVKSSIPSNYTYRISEDDWHYNIIIELKNN
jgi:hypothetical protein